MNPSAGYIVYQLRALLSEGALVHVFTDPENPDDFIAGYLRAVSQRHILLETVTPYGRMDGFFVIRTSCILEVGHDALYAQRLSLLLDLQGQTPDPLPPAQPEDSDLLRSACAFAQDHSRVITVWTHEESFSGYVQGVDDLRLTLGVVDFLGQNPLPESLALRDIELCSLGGEEERMYELLRKASPAPGPRR